jgi:hypothetical protein
MFAAGAMILGHALRSLTPEAPPQPLIVGGVDLTGVNLTQPFMVDFSVERTSTALAKLQAFNRLRAALDAFRQWQPRWLLQPDTDVSKGRLILYALPMG